MSTHKLTKLILIIFALPHHLQPRQPIRRDSLPTLLHSPAHPARLHLRRAAWVSKPGLEADAVVTHFNL